MSVQNYKLLSFTIFETARFLEYLKLKCCPQRGNREAKAPFWILKFLAKKVAFLVLSGKKQISPVSASPWKNFGKIIQCLPPRKKSFRRPCLRQWITHSLSEGRSLAIHFLPIVLRTCWNVGLECLL